MKTISEGDNVLLYLDEKRTYLVKIKADTSFHTHKGYVQLGALIGKEFGSSITSNLGSTFYALRPLVRDQVLKMKRRTQIMYPKDMGFIALMSGLGPGSRVVEAGTGSGALTSVLANLVRPRGVVYSYEIREDFQKEAQASLQKAGLSEFVEFKLKDVVQGIDEKDVDAVILDLAVPWLVVANAYPSLTGGGMFVSFSPTIEQVMKTVDALAGYPFVEIETYELILRRISVGNNRTRPETLMVGHTGYITCARKVLTRQGETVESSKLNSNEIEEQRLEKPRSRTLLASIQTRAPETSLSSENRAMAKSHSSRWVPTKWHRHTVGAAEHVKMSTWQLSDTDSMIFEVPICGCIPVVCND